MSGTENAELISWGSLSQVGLELLLPLTERRELPLSWLTLLRRTLELFSLFCFVKFRLQKSLCQAKDLHHFSLLVAAIKTSVVSQRSPPSFSWTRIHWPTGQRIAPRRTSFLWIAYWWSLHCVPQCPWLNAPQCIPNRIILCRETLRLLFSALSSVLWRKTPSTLLILIQNLGQGHGPVFLDWQFCQETRVLGRRAVCVFLSSPLLAWLPSWFECKMSLTGSCI